MTATPGQRRPPALWAVALKWVLLAGGLGLLLQTAWCLWENLADAQYFAKHFVAAEAEALADRTAFRDGRAYLRESQDLPYFTEPVHPAYRFRLRDASCHILIERGQWPPDPTGASPACAQTELWVYQHGPGRLDIGGAMRRRVDGEDLWFEIATVGDPEWRRTGALVAELTEDVWVPLLPALLLISGFLLGALRNALKPLLVAAGEAERLGQTASLAPFDVRGMPSEAARFAVSVNNLLARIERLMGVHEHVASLVAHEMKTPLATMLLELELIDDPRARRLEEDVRAMSATVDTVLALAREDACGRQRVCLAEVVAEACERLRGLIAERGHTITMAQHGPLPFEGWRANVLQAVQNLIENALRHTPPGGRIMVTCGPGSVVTVDDSGEGIPPEERERLFQPFIRGHGGGEGTGLGLTLVKRVAAMHSGRLELAPSPLGGARFRLGFSPDEVAVRPQLASTNGQQGADGTFPD